ncbi:ComF family protein, partial [Campylobacter upsaliensis]|nr:ComF family protein [Campylobacter upsaliensis]
ILVDDIVTTGSSILEAKKILEKNKISVLFALVLADAKD